jgi:hypothetical protein
MTYNSTDDEKFHEYYPSPNNGNDLKRKIIATATAVGLVYVSYNCGYNDAQKDFVEKNKVVKVENQD